MTITLTWAAIAVIVAILGHAGFTIWHASRINTTVQSVGVSLERINDELKKRDDQISAMWKKIDSNVERIIKIEARL